MAGGRSQSTAFLVMVAVASLICLSNVAADSSSVPDVNLVYDMTQFPWNTEAFCVTGDTTLDLTATTIPDRHKEPKVVKEGPNKIKFTRDLEARHLGQALMCTANNKGILVPLMTSDAKFIPRRLTVTVSQEQDLRLDLKTKSTQELFWWMREPVKKTGPWTPARVADDKLRIEHSLLQGSGLYSIAYNQDTIVYKELGFLAVTIRECREHQYGRACEEWCPDCMYGGECDAVTGECVCPPGLKGHRCQIKCNENKIGKSCNIDIDGNGKQICLVAPYGCECAPGYNGTKCETACSDGYWGAGCHQTCSHCVEGCTAIAGLCKKDKNADCVGGDLGLPRLRKPPRVTEIKHDRVTVTFDPWKAGYDDGELPSGSSLNYVVAYWVKDEGKSPVYVTDASTVQQLTGLTGKTDYKLQVLVQVTEDGKVCAEDGKKRGRVHTVDFSTVCPDAPPVVKGIRTTERKPAMLTIEWEEIPYLSRCDLEYVFEIFNVGTTSNPIDKKDLTTGKYTVDKLTPFTNYTIRVSTKNTQTGDVRSSAPYTERTHPTVPDPPSIEIQVKETSVLFSWRSKANGSVFYEYAYKMKPELCEADSTFTNRNTTERSVEVPTRPYHKVVLRVKAGNEEGVSDYEEVENVTQAAPPTSRVEAIHCSPDQCNAALERDCKTYNGPGLAIQYTLAPVDRRWKLCHEKVFNESLVSKRLPVERVLDLTHLLPHTFYRAEALAANDEGVAQAHLGKSTTFRTRSTAPGAVTSFRVSSAHDSLTMTWKEPEQCPPTGELKEYLISWKQVSASKFTEITTRFKEQFIDQLEINTTYLVKVQAINEDVSAPGPAVEKEVTTTEGKPMIPRDIRIVDVTKKQMTVTWLPLDSPPKEITVYQVGIFETSRRLMNLTKTLSSDKREYTFSNLRPGHQYNLTVRICKSILCSDSAWELEWTVPRNPKVEGRVAWVSAVPSAIRIALPYILRDSAVHVKNSQYVLVRRDEGDSWKWGEKDNLISIVKKSQDSGPSDVTSTEWICALLKHDEVARAPDAKFVVGDNITRHGFHNLPLEDDKCYLVAVVSKAVAGRHETYHVSDVESLCKGTHPVLVAVGVVFGIVLLVILTGLALRLRNGKRTEKKLLGGMAVQHCNGIVNIMEYPHDTATAAPDTPVSTQQVPVVPPESTAPLEPKEENRPRESHIYENTSRRVPKEHIEAYLARAINSQDIDFEFKSVPVTMNKSCSDGERAENRRKNRYRNNLPYNDTRIRLPVLHNQPFSDYVNASLIKGHMEDINYIATQGPKDDKKETVSDFWRMVWHCRSNIIIMVANLVENGQMKVAQYWPENQPVFCAGLQINLVDVEVKVEYIIRRMLVTFQNEVLEVTQYQYIAWPDHGVPHNPFGLALMLSAIRKQQAEGPAIVHCSAGIGRTGTILFVLLALDQINASSYIDAHMILTQLRNGRPKLIENTIQYNFAHRILQEYLYGVNTSFACGDFPKELSKLRQTEPESDASMLGRQYRKLKSLPKVLSFNIAKDPALAHLNRDPEILPADNRLVFVQCLGGGMENQYVNAVRVNGLDRKDAYIAAEHPQQHTMHSLWAIVYEKRIPAWVLLQSFPEDDEEYPSVIPAAEKQVMGHFELTLTGLQSFQNFIEYYIEINVPGAQRTSPHLCVVVMMKGWPHDQRLPSSVEPLLAVMERAESLNDPSASTLITCRDGVTATGVMMALFLLIERIKLFQEVDVYRSVQEIIYARPEFITSVDQYDLLHEAAATYLEAYNTYGNFN